MTVWVALSGDYLHEDMVFENCVFFNKHAAEAWLKSRWTSRRWSLEADAEASCNVDTKDGGRKIQFTMVDGYLDDSGYENRWKIGMNPTLEWRDHGDQVTVSINGREWIGIMEQEVEE